jgi:adenosylcobinamide kinase/adenosylcobinamide-phosphate guanylyltransferase
MMKIVFITGGARSGKSSFAEKMAMKSGKKVVYVATAQVLDQEMAMRVNLHKKRRPKNWKTIEEPKLLSKVLKDIGINEAFIDCNLVLIDCIALLVSNWLPLEKAEEKSLWSSLRKNLLDEIEAMLDNAKNIRQDVIIVSNEVGSGIVPEYPLARLYRDLLGEANQLIARAADEVFFMVSGLPMKIK